MNINKLYDSPIMKKLQVWGGKIQGNKAYAAISAGLMSAMGLILAGSVFSIIATILNIVGVLEMTDPLYKWLSLPNSMTMGIISLAVVYTIGHAYAANLGMKGEILNGINCLIIFLIVAAPVQTVTLADGTTTLTCMDTSFLGATGMFVAIIIAVVVTKITKLCRDKKIYLRMPSAVPQFLQDSFASLVPLVINIVLWHGLNYLCQTFMTTSLPGVIMGILSLPLGALNSWGGMYVLILLCMIFWTMGIHGTGIVYIVLMSSMMELLFTNAALHEAGQPMLINPTVLFGATTCCGGTGNLLAPAVICLMSKSKRLKAVGKAGVVPAIFNISEPMVFGLPIMYNPLLAIPFILATLIWTAVSHVLYVVGFFQPSYIAVMTSLPICLQNYITNFAPTSLLMAPICFVITYIVWLPFMKAYDKQLCAAEEKENA